MDAKTTHQLKARLCWKILATGQVGKEDWRPVTEAEMYLKHREFANNGKCQNWIEYEEQTDDQR